MTETLRTLAPSGALPRRLGGGKPRPAAPSEPQVRVSANGSESRTALVVLAAALALGILLAKAIDWRGHAHPRH